MQGSKVILLSAQGRKFDQAKAREFAGAQELLLICGRYEGVDERVAEHLADEELSIGDFVLSGGELAAAMVVDAVARLQEGVLGNKDSAFDESFSEEGLLDWPQYTPGRGSRWARTCCSAATTRRSENGGNRRRWIKQRTPASEEHVMPKTSAAAKQARQEQILGAAVHCFARKGYYATTIEDLVSETCLSRGALYLYFPNKEALYLALADRWNCGVEEAVQRRVTPGLSPGAVLQLVIEVTGAQIEADDEACRVLMEGWTLDT